MNKYVYCPVTKNISYSHKMNVPSYINKNLMIHNNYGFYYSNSKNNCLYNNFNNNNYYNNNSIINNDLKHYNNNQNYNNFKHKNNYNNHNSLKKTSNLKNNNLVNNKNLLFKKKNKKNIVDTFMKKKEKIYEYIKCLNLNDTIVKYKDNKNNTRQLTGVGVLILCNYMGMPHLLLGREDRKSLIESKNLGNIMLPLYEEFGGSIQNKKAGIRKNALFELREETSNLINIKNERVLEKAIYFDLPFLDKRAYRLYLLYLDNIENYIDYFFLNHEKIVNNTSSKFQTFDNKINTYLEMNNLELINLNKIEKSLNNPNNILNIDGLKWNYNILTVNKEVYINNRLLNFFNTNFNDVSGLDYIKFYCSYISSFKNEKIYHKLINKKYDDIDDIIKDKLGYFNVKGLVKNNKQYNNLFSFLNGTYSIIIK